MLDQIYAYMLICSYAYKKTEYIVFLTRGVNFFLFVLFFTFIEFSYFIVELLCYIYSFICGVILYTYAVLAEVYSQM
jgi:hypothetical protein